jgi:hypothetical protein
MFFVTGLGVNVLDKRLIAGIVIVVIGVSITGVLFLLPRPTIQYHKTTTADYADYKVGIHNIRDCDINVSFTDNPTLLYTMTIETDGSSNFYLHEDSYQTLLNYYEGPGLAQWSGEEVSVKSIDLLLGTGKAYKLDFWGTRLNVTFNYGNGAVIGQNSFVWLHSDNGTVVVNYDGTDVDDSTLGDSSDPVRIDFDLGTQHLIGYDLVYAELNIDLPYFYYGDLDINSETFNVTMSGWNRTLNPDIESYFTDNVEGEGDPPNCYIDVIAVDVVANLVKATSP